MERLIAIVFVAVFALAYMIVTHYLTPLLIGKSVTDLSYGLIIGCLFWIILKKK